jgi:alkane 1-monooxygenase
MLTVLGNLLGGFWTIGNVIFTLGILVVSDWFFSEDTDAPLSHSRWFVDGLLAVHVIGHSVAIFSLIYSIYNGTISGGFILSAILATGVNSGISGIIVAHELIHRNQKSWRALGIWNLFLCLYSHFYIEHIKAHHKHAATPLDSATARYGESVYDFTIRTVPEQFISSLHIESARLQRKGASSYGLKNFVVIMTALQLMFTIAVLITFGVLPAIAFLAQAVLAIFLLEISNYAQHYGLERAESERISSVHSWQTDNISSRLFLLELPRHSDHHFYAARPYDELLSYPESPKFPTGYLGLLPIVLIPKLWFKMTDQALSEFKQAH